MTLISKGELERVMLELNIKEYFADIDMNGAISITLQSDERDKIEYILSMFAQIDLNRTTDDIYKANEILYPLKKIAIDDEDDDEYILERFKSKNIKSSRYSQQLNSWVSNNPSESHAKIPRVAFYSYKGGVGRSTALAIVARLLAKEGLKVAVLDLDLEAPGLNSLLLTKPKPSPFGVVDYLYHVPWGKQQIDQKRFLSQYVVREDIPRRNKKPGQIIVMSAGGTVVDEDGKQIRLLFDDDEVDIKLEPNYLQKLSYIDFDIYSRQSTNIFELLLNDMANYTGADIILFDARTGFSNVSGALLNQFSDVLSIHVQNNQQNKEGIEFISKYIHKEKLQNTIWNNTKSTVEDRRTGSELKEFIQSKVISEYGEASMFVYNELPFIRSLDNINAYRLKDVIEMDRPFVHHYAELTDQILNMTDLNKKMPNYIDEPNKLSIINDLENNIKRKVKATYISQRFLSEDLQTFIGFPGSGKNTFKNYMNARQINVDVISFEEFNKMESSAHRILSHMVFLDWNFDEATQAVCKWILHSEKFITWLVGNPQLKDSVNMQQLNQMRDEPEFELDPKLASEILEIVFQSRGREFQGWRTIFSLLQYRDGFVLPSDIMSGVENYINFWAVRFATEEKRANGSRAIFPLLSHRQSLLQIWREIGNRKREWLVQFDKDLLSLVLAIRELRQDFFTTEKQSIEDAKFNLNKSLPHISATDFEILFEKATNMEIIRTRLLKQAHRISLSPVYELIE